jgi:probable phosphoglycerate mutase
MVELWLVRHGETTASAGGRLAGWRDVPLTARGRDQARALRPVLEGRGFASAWTSDLGRARETARLAWGEAAPDRRLREVHFGDLEGTAFTEVETGLSRRLMAFREVELPGGESLTEARRRVAEHVAGLTPGRHLLFVHGGVIRLLTQDLGLDAFVATTTVVRVDWAGRSLLGLRDPETGWRP